MSWLYRFLRKASASEIEIPRADLEVVEGNVTITAGDLAVTAGDATVGGTVNGFPFASGAGAPSGAGTLNTIYLDTTNHNLYICTEATGTWKDFTRTA